jgi:hypothetical protein
LYWNRIGERRGIRESATEKGLVGSGTDEWSAERRQEEGVKKRQESEVGMGRAKGRDKSYM